MKETHPILERLGLEDDGIITPDSMFKSRQINPLPKHITTAVILFDPHPPQTLLDESELLFNFVAASSILKQYIYKNKIVLAYAPLGGPAVAGLIEELIVFGIKRFIACGSSGLIGEFDTKKFLLVSKAIRDEGLSYHYLKASTFVNTNQALNQAIIKQLKQRNIQFSKGITWTTDAFYKETKKRIDKRKEQGAIAVEMECASMAAVCQFRNVQFSQLLYFSDIINQEGWSDFLDTRAALKEQVNQLIIDIAYNIDD